MGRTGDRQESFRPVVPHVRGSERVASEADATGVTAYLDRGRDTDGFELFARWIREAGDKRRAQLSQRATAPLGTARGGIGLLNPHTVVR